MKRIFIFIVSILFISNLALARSERSGSGHSRSYSNHSRSNSYYSGSNSSSSKVITGVPRDSHGRIKRSEVAKRDFMKETGHPNGWPGHVIDHINPLACGGADAPSNMQWQTIAEGKAKDKVERQGCK